MRNEISHRIAAAAATKMVKDGDAAGLTWTDIATSCETAIAIVVSCCAEASGTPDKERFASEIIDSVTEHAHRRVLALIREFHTMADPMTRAPDPADVERVARAIEGAMFAAHELPLGAELHAKYLDTATAALAAMGSPGWQPIATAPRDGTEVLLYGPKHDQIVLHFDDGMWWTAEGDGYSESVFTHWMCLPLPPEPAT